MPIASLHNMCWENSIASMISAAFFAMAGLLPQTCRAQNGLYLLLGVWLWPGLAHQVTTLIDRFRCKAEVVFQSSATTSHTS